MKLHGISDHCRKFASIFPGTGSAIGVKERSGFFRYGEPESGFLLGFSVKGDFLQVRTHRGKFFADLRCDRVCWCDAGGIGGNGRYHLTGPRSIAAFDQTLHGVQLVMQKILVFILKTLDMFVVASHHGSKHIPVTFLPEKGHAG